MILLGVLSDQRAHRSKSPALHNRVLEQEGIAGVYLPLAVEPGRIGQALAGLAPLGFRGVNVTVPHKEAVLSHLDSLAPEAAKVQAVNTIVVEEGRLIGHNTDILGFASALQAAWKSGPLERAPLAQALVVGSGGAAKAVVQGLGSLGLTEIAVCSRTRPESGRFAGPVRWRPLETLGQGEVETDLVVNTTPVSAPGEDPGLAGLVGRTRLQGCGLVFDLNYGRDENIWQGLAERCGAGFQDGLTMLALQAAASFRLWTGIEAGERFLAALEQA